MTRRTIRLAGGPATAGLAERFEAIRAELKVPAEFAADVLAEAADVAARRVETDADLTALPFRTVDPPGARDLDQAMHLARREGGGYLVDYAIADVPAFVRPGGAIDAEAMRRGQTIYAPDRRTPLHPPVLSEDVASLLPGGDRPAFVWRFELDGRGEVLSTDLVRATIRSVEQLDYETVQAAADAHPGESTPDGVAGLAVLLREIGTRRLDLERERGGASLGLPDQEVVADGDGWTLRLRPPVPAEDWNAQLSLMTGMAAAQLMLKAGVGILRTLPPPDPDAIGWFRREARALGQSWPRDVPYGEFLRGLDPTDPRHLALLHSAGALFRGAGYAWFDGEPPAGAGHAAVAAPYAHVTAPLRRLVDRFGLSICHAVQTGGTAPDAVRAALPRLPDVMSASDRLAGEVERRCVNTVEAALLSGRTGQTFRAIAVDVDKDGDGGSVQLLDPVVLARCAGRLTAGEEADVRLEVADVATGDVRFAAL